MSKQEFLEQLGQALAGRVDGGAVNDNLSYYEEYIATRVRGGSSEEEVVAELGDPRLLARSISEATKRIEGTEQTGQDDRDNVKRTAEEYPACKGYRVPAWLIVVAVFFLGVLLLGAAFSILSLLLPIIIPVALIFMVIRMIERR